jgi:RHS repeat-associated protein
LDLSQSLQGAGGIGGLLNVIESSSSHAYLYEENGNVGQMVDVSDGSIDARYRYDPFGNDLLVTGPLAAGNPFRFSTKYFDVESGLYYYGRRYYSPDLGRWTSRDPIEEEGGLNLYGFVKNDPIGLIDPLGQDFIAVGSNAAHRLIPAEIGGHLSITYWKDDVYCVKEGDLKRDTISSNETNWERPRLVGRRPHSSVVGNNAKYQEVIELHWKRDFETSYRIAGDRSNQIYTDRVAVSRIINSVDQDNADLFVVIFADTKNQQESSVKWETIRQKAHSYGYAEHQPFSIGYVAKNWPNSKYGFLVDGNHNNSNTFIRYLTDSIGRSADVFPGRMHPGNLKPIPIRDGRPAPVFVGGP